MILSLIHILHLILLHEWQHFRNRDQWSKLLCYLLCCVFWWNPFLWLLKNKMDQLLELRCDFSVLEKIDTFQQDDYYEMLLGTYRAAREKHSMPCLLYTSYTIPEGNFPVKIFPGGFWREKLRL